MIGEQETWLPIIGYEELYSISDKKRVKSLPKSVIRGKYNAIRNMPEKILSNKTGDVSLVKNGIKKTFDINTLYEIMFNNFLPKGDRKEVLVESDNNIKVIKRRQLCQIIKSFKPKTSKFPGVVKRGNKFTACIEINKKDIYLGTFLIEKEAYFMYKKAIKNDRLFLGNAKNFRNTLNSIL